MPVITEQPATVYLHCRNVYCPGNDQQQAEGRRVEEAQTFGENGGDGIFTHFVERSMVVYRADEAQLPCPGCGEDREVTGDPRPSYQPLSGYDPRGLLDVPKFDAGRQAEITSVPAHIRGESDEEMESRLRATLREEQMMARLRAELDESDGG